MFTFTDGQRFRCPRSFLKPTPSLGALEHAKACVRIASIAISAAQRAMIVAVAKARSCLSSHGLQSVGAPGFPDMTIAWGEVRVGRAPVSAQIDFYPSAAGAKRLEPAVYSIVKGSGGHIEQRGAVIVGWVTRAPTSALRTAVQTCAFG